MDTQNLNDNVAELKEATKNLASGHGAFWYFNPANGGFYKPGVNMDVDTNTAGMVLLTDEEYRTHMEGRGVGGKVFKVVNGKPALVDPDPPSPEMLAQIYTRRKNTLMSEATSHISTLQAAVDLDIATDAEKDELKTWQTVAVQIRRIDVTAKDITWPKLPNQA